VSEYGGASPTPREAELDRPGAEAPPRERSIGQSLLLTPTTSAGEEEA